MQVRHQFIHCHNNIFYLFSIHFLVISNIWFAFWLLAEYWADAFIDLLITTSNIYLLNDNSKLRINRIVTKALLLLPTCITLHLYTWNFICHFISQPFSLVQSFCKSLQLASTFTNPSKFITSKVCVLTFCNSETNASTWCFQAADSGL